MPEEQPPKLCSRNIKTRAELARHIRLYFEVRTQSPSCPDRLLTPTQGRPPLPQTVEFELEDSENHIVALLSATTYFHRPTTSVKHHRWKILDVQRNLDNYVTADSQLIFPDELVVANHVRRLTVGPHGFLTKAFELTEYTLPYIIPPKHVLIDKIRSVLNANGGTFENSWEHVPITDLIGIGENGG